MEEYDYVYEYEAVIKLDLLFGIWLEYFGDNRLLREYHNANHDSKAHSVNVSHLCISNCFCMLTLSDVMADHTRDRVGEAEREHESEG